MKLWHILLACALLPACTADVPEPPAGMPLDREHMPIDPEKALTRISSDAPEAIQ
jgi:outer membrane biogenesis lipoprotein LolB